MTVPRTRRYPRRPITRFVTYDVPTAEFLRDVDPARASEWVSTQLGPGVHLTGYIPTAKRSPPGQPQYMDVDFTTTGEYAGDAYDRLSQIMRGKVNITITEAE